MLLYQIVAFTIPKKYKNESYENKEFKISGPKWIEKFELSDGSCSVSAI